MHTCGHRNSLIFIVVATTVDVIKFIIDFECLAWKCAIS